MGANQSPGYLLLSYNRQDEETAKKIGQKLHDGGYNVLLDEIFRTDRVTSTSEMVKHSGFVLGCFSETYQKSFTCEKVAESIEKYEKGYITLMLESGLTDDVWGETTSTNNVDFSNASDDSEFHASMMHLEYCLEKNNQFRRSLVSKAETTANVPVTKESVPEVKEINNTADTTSNEQSCTDISKWKTISVKDENNRLLCVIRSPVDRVCGDPFVATSAPQDITVPVKDDDVLACQIFSLNPARKEVEPFIYLALPIPGEYRGSCLKELVVLSSIDDGVTWNDVIPHEYEKIFREHKGVKFLEIEVKILGMYAIIHRPIEKEDVDISKDGGTITPNYPNVKITYGENSFQPTQKLKLMVEQIDQSVVRNLKSKFSEICSLISCSPMLSFTFEEGAELGDFVPAEITLPCPEMTATKKLTFISGELHSTGGDDSILFGYHVLSLVPGGSWSVSPCEVTADTSTGTLKFKMLNICESVKVIGLQTSQETGLPEIANILNIYKNVTYSKIILGHKKENDRRLIFRLTQSDELDEAFQELTEVQCYKIIFTSKDLPMKEALRLKMCLEGNIQEVSCRKDTIMFRFHRKQAMRKEFLIEAVDPERNWGSEKHRGQLSFFIEDVNKEVLEPPPDSPEKQWSEVGRVEVNIVKDAPITKKNSLSYFNEEGIFSATTMKSLSERLSIHWMKLAQRLAVANSTIQKLQKDYKTVTRRCYIMLGKWHQGQTTNQSESLKTLSEALDYIGRRDLVQWLQDTLSFDEEPNGETIPELDRDIAECSPS